MPQYERECEENHGYDDTRKAHPKTSDGEHTSSPAKMKFIRNREYDKPFHRINASLNPAHIIHLNLEISNGGLKSLSIDGVSMFLNDLPKRMDDTSHFLSSW